MSHPLLKDNPHYVASARAIRALHRLIWEHQGDSDEADQFRDEADEHWPHLSVREIEWLQCLSADLYTLRESADRPRDVTAAHTLTITKEILSADDADDVHGVLTLTRAHDSEFSPAYAGFIRASYWTKLGDYETALFLLEDVVSREPQDLHLRLAYLISLWVCDDERVIDEASELFDNPRLTANDAILVGTILVLSAYDRSPSLGRSNEDPRSFESDAVDRVVRKLQDVLSDGSNRPTPEFESIAHQILGFCHWWQAGMRSPALDRPGRDTLIPTSSPNLELLSRMAEILRLQSRNTFTSQAPRSAA